MILMMGSKRKHLSLSDKVKILQCQDAEKLSGRSLAAKFNIGRTQAMELVKNKETIYKLWLENGDEDRKHVKSRKTNCAAINEIVFTNGSVQQERRIFQLVGH